MILSKEKKNEREKERKKLNSTNCLQILLDLGYSTVKVAHYLSSSIKPRQHKVVNEE